MITIFDDFIPKYDEHYIAKENIGEEGKNLYHWIWKNENYYNDICDFLERKGFKQNSESAKKALMRGNLTRVELIYNPEWVGTETIQISVEYFDGIGGFRCKTFERKLDYRPTDEIRLHDKLTAETKLDKKSTDKQNNVVVLSKKVFIVHGRDEKAKEAVESVLKEKGYEPIVLANLPDRGLTIFEKFKQSSSDVKYAVIIYTPCDVGRLSTDLNKSYRARQNVVFEHGFFSSALGREKVSMIVKGEIDLPSDVSGILYIQMDAEAHWKKRLISEIENSAAFSTLTTV